MAEDIKEGEVQIDTEELWYDNDDRDPVVLLLHPGSYMERSAWGQALRGLNGGCTGGVELYFDVLEKDEEDEEMRLRGTGWSLAKW